MTSERVSSARPCRSCGEPFVPNWPSRKWCLACRPQREQRGQRKRPDTYCGATGEWTWLCEQCGGPFAALSANARRCPSCRHGRDGDYTRGACRCDACRNAARISKGAWDRATHFRGMAIEVWPGPSRLVYELGKMMARRGDVVFV